MINRTTIALSVAIILGAASAALGSDHDEGGGFVMPGSMDGVNPAYHPDWFPNYAASTADKAYGYVASPKTKHRSSQK